MQIFLAEVNDFSSGWLNEEETRHCIKVLRHHRGDEIFCIDGKGNGYKARIENFDPKKTQLQFIEHLPNWGEHSGHIRLIVSPLRLKDRFEWLIEKAVELGVNEIVPVSCQRTDKYKAKFKATRLETIILTAVKQCKRSNIPTLHPIQALTDYLMEGQEGERYIAYVEAAEPLQSFHSQIVEASQINLLIGPEGDFTEGEVVWAEDHGYKRVSLGENRLRTETAGVYGLGVLKMLKGY